MPFGDGSLAQKLDDVFGESYWLNAAVLFVAINLRMLLVVTLVGWPLRRSLSNLNTDIQGDTKLGFLSTAVFAGVLAGSIKLYAMGLTRVYLDPGQYGWIYIPCSYLIVLLVQDTVFYFMHRLFHYPQLYWLTHRGHHRSKQPSPWTSFALDPIESLVHSLLLVMLVILLPLHLVTILAVLTTMSAWAMVNHLSPEILPRWFPHHWLGDWIIGPVHHSIHHKYHNRHYGLYFTLWDRLMNTQDPRYPIQIQQSPSL
ncbi:fatty acid hydroxylase superfamily protein [Synechococcus sp. WH 8101]|uniref:sterol desaturase family protein n=1 Tax=Synechococcus sp. WH 8101 TaxID=59932 RepID=UPI0018630A7B|nr:sterol desaturase family protein [Synechococcus sp. WH 8101]QNI44901.1 fatty acid hydroxylase superfamily protein [Synechococcus sp. WH 8101]